MPTAPQLVLALDTSTDMLACALAEVAPGEPPRVLSAGDHLCRRHANEELVSTALSCLSEAGRNTSDLNAVLVGRGPGSFTGVRIGIATAKGLACGLECACQGASTLDAVAWRAWRSGVRGQLAVVGDAMRGEVYPGVYQLADNGPRRTFASETVVKADACVHALAALPGAPELWLTGDGLKKYRDKFGAAGLANVLGEALWHPTGEGVLLAAYGLAGVMASQSDPALVLPVYTRLSDAEETERARLGLGKPGFVEPSGVAEGLAGIHLQLRPMSLNDLDAVAALEAGAFAHAPHTAWTRDMFYEDFSQPARSWWVAHDQGSLVGFAGGVLAGDEMEVSDVVVAEGRRREGIATRLLARVTYDGQMLGATSTSLEVDARNEAARALYERLGYEVAGIRPSYYGPGDDALFMRAPLPLALGARDDAPDPTTQTRPWPPVRTGRAPEAEGRVVAAQPLILAFESSCDETAAAVIASDGTVLSSVVATQIDFHARFGGVVPEIASRKHTEAIVGVYEEAMGVAGERLGVGRLAPRDLAAVAVTQGPGLVGALVVGIAFAKGLAGAANLPLIGVNHLEGHLAANLFETPDLRPPFVASLVSGGNTMLVHVREWGRHTVLGETIDDAVGEAFDKVAKALGLGYPGGPAISRLAATGNPRAIRFPRAMLHSHDYRFSLSGLKTAVVTYIQGENKAGRPINLPDLCASFEAAVVDVQVAKAVAAVAECEVGDFCVGGGVAANRALREAYQHAFAKRGVRVTVPPMSVCGDNAAMIALVALREYRAGRFADLTMDAAPNLRLTE